MKKIIACILLLLVTFAAFAENIVINNETIYPVKNQKTKIAIQWATTARDIQESNKALTYGLKLDPDSLQILSTQGNIKLSIPKNAEHFRVLVWSKGDEAPDLLTNWVDVIPNKTYTLENDQLAPAVLMSGMGC